MALFGEMEPIWPDLVALFVTLRDRTCHCGTDPHLNMG